MKVIEPCNRSVRWIRKNGLRIWIVVFSALVIYGYWQNHTRSTQAKQTASSAKVASARATEASIQAKRAAKSAQIAAAQAKVAAQAGKNAQRAGCSLLHDYVTRRRETVAFLKTHPNGFDGVSGEDLKRSIVQLTANIGALAPLNCHNG